MRHFLLLHGSWHGAWCWYKVAPRLETEGHQVTVIDLPGRGANSGRPIWVGLGHMVEAARAVLPRDKKTTVVVHSRYGVLASQLAQLVPDQIERTIYLASFMLPDGKRVASYFRKDKGSILGPAVEINRIGMWDWLRPDIYREALYHDCNDDDNVLARHLLCREPLRPALATLHLSEDRYGRVPRGYIRLTEDRAVSPWLQDELLNETSVDRVESIQASHSAYFSKPDELVKTILKIAGD